jgi:hypothetical protein
MATQGPERGFGEKDTSVGKMKMGRRGNVSLIWNFGNSERMGKTNFTFRSRDRDGWMWIC